MSIRPFDDIRSLFQRLPPPDEGQGEAAMARQRGLVKPQGALGRLEEIPVFIARWQGRAPAVRRPAVALFAGNHGVVAQGVSAYPASVTAAMLPLFAEGRAAINQICATFDLGLKVFDLALEYPTGDITLGPAMSESECASAMAYGMQAISEGVDLLCIGEMGIGNTTAAAALYGALFGGTAADWTGRGTGLDDAGLIRKTEAVERALHLHVPAAAGDPLDLLRRLGGREIAAMAGAILAARIERVPVILDGYVSTAAAAVLHAVTPDATAHCLAGHRSAEGAHAAVLARLGLEPLLDLGLRLGEGSGAALAAGLVRAALACHDGMAALSELEAG